MPPMRGMIFSVLISEFPAGGGLVKQI